MVPLTSERLCRPWCMYVLLGEAGGSTRMWLWLSKGVWRGDE